jgi:uncharacterized protein YpuA (DUF1002 family)
MTKDEILLQIETDWDNMQNDLSNAKNPWDRFMLFDDAKTGLFNNIEKLMELAYEAGQNNMLESMN